MQSKYHQKRSEVGMKPKFFRHFILEIVRSGMRSPENVLKRRRWGAITVLTLLLAACDGPKVTEQRSATDGSNTNNSNGGASTTRSLEDSRPASRSSSQGASGMANPADEHCVEAGYRLDFIRKQGIPVDALCINDKTGAKCETWAFFRGECVLDAAPRRSEIVHFTR